MASQRGHHVHVKVRTQIQQHPGAPIFILGAAGPVVTQACSGLAIVLQKWKYVQKSSFCLVVWVFFRETRKPQESRKLKTLIDFCFEIFQGGIHLKR